jgi:CubicO group peptidase (beta-lactamase class C family)
MTSDHLAGVVSSPQMPGELLLGSKGYTFGLGFAVRTADGVAAFPGTAGDFNWAGYAGTYFWVDPAQDLVPVLMTQAPSPVRAQGTGDCYASSFIKRSLTYSENINR